MKQKNILIIFLCFFLGACSTSIDEYAGTEPKFDMREFFDGKTVAHGILQDFSGKVIRTFRVDIDGKFDGNKGVLDEDFIFDDGEKDKRIWYIEFLDDNNFIANADDAVGEARGKQVGRALNMKYVLRIPYKDSTLDVTLDDWMFKIDDNNLMNVSYMSKFGVPVGTITIYFKKL